ncbi:hypothetical protein D3C80_1407970 [compost metagenome]
MARHFLDTSSIGSDCFGFDIRDAARECRQEKSYSRQLEVCPDRRLGFQSHHQSAGRCRHDDNAGGRSLLSGPQTGARGEPDRLYHGDRSGPVDYQRRPVGASR